MTSILRQDPELLNLYVGDREFPVKPTTEEIEVFGKPHGFLIANYNVAIKKYKKYPIHESEIESFNVLAIDAWRQSKIHYGLTFQEAKKQGIQLPNDCYYLGVDKCCHGDIPDFGCQSCEKAIWFAFFKSPTVPENEAVVLINEAIELLSELRIKSEKVKQSVNEMDLYNVQILLYKAIDKFKQQSK